MSTNITDSVVGLFMGFGSKSPLKFFYDFLVPVHTPFFNTYLFHILLWDDLIDDENSKNGTKLFLSKKLKH